VEFPKTRSCLHSEINRNPKDRDQNPQRTNQSPLLKRRDRSLPQRKDQNLLERQDQHLLEGENYLTDQGLPEGEEDLQERGQNPLDGEEIALSLLDEATDLPEGEITILGLREEVQGLLRGPEALELTEVDTRHITPKTNLTQATKDIEMVLPERWMESLPPQR